MWKIGYLMICEDIGKNPLGELIMKPLGAITPVNIPGNYSFNIAFSLYNEDIDQSNDQDGKIRFIVRNPNGNIVEDTGELNFLPQQKKQERSEHHSIATGEADIRMNNVVLNSEGLYEIELMLNGESKLLKIPVKMDRRDNHGGIDGKPI